MIRDSGKKGVGNGLLRAQAFSWCQNVPKRPSCPRPNTRSVEMACLQEWDADRRQAAHAEKSLAVRELVRLSLRVQSTGVVAELHLDTALVAPSGHRDGRRHALADRAAAAQAVAAPPSGGCMRRPLPVGLSPRSGRSFAPGRRFPVCGVDSAVIHPPDSSASRRGLRGHSRWPRGRRGITLPPEQRVVLPLLARVLRCAAPRLCCLPGCPSRPHRPHPLPHPLPLRLGPRHCRCRCLRHSRRRFPPPHPLRRRRLRCSPSTLTPARAAVGCGCPDGTSCSRLGAPETTSARLGVC